MGRTEGWAKHLSGGGDFSLRYRNDLLCVGWGVKLYSLTHLLTHSLTHVLAN